MKSLLQLVTVIFVAILFIVGIVFFFTATSTNQFVPQGARTMSLICGIICLILATALLAVAAVSFRLGEDQPTRPHRPHHHAEVEDTIRLPENLDEKPDSGDCIRPI